MIGSKPPYPGEVVYENMMRELFVDALIEESVRTMLTEDTKNAFMCIGDCKREKELRNGTGSVWVKKR